IRMRHDRVERRIVRLQARCFGAKQIEEGLSTHAEIEPEYSLAVEIGMGVVGIAGHYRRHREHPRSITDPSGVVKEETIGIELDRYDATERFDFLTDPKVIGDGQFHTFLYEQGSQRMQ